MSKVLVTESNLHDIADAIRSKNEGTDNYRPGDMAAAILAIPVGGTMVSKTITQNGEYDPEDDNADGYSDVTVNVPNSYTAEDEGKVVSSGVLVAQTSTTLTENGTYDTTENNEVVVNVSGGSGGKEIDIYAFDFSPNTNANTAKSGGLQISPLYDLRIVGIRFWARDNACSVYISDISGNVIAEKQDAVVTANQWNDVLFDTPVMLEKNTSYVIWGSNQTSTMRYVNTNLSSLFVTLEAVKYSTAQDTFPTNTESGSAKYGVDLIIAFGTGIVELGTLNATQNGTYDASDDSLDGYDHVVVNVSGGGGGSSNILSGTSEPTSAQGSDGDIYLKYGIENEDLSTFSIYKESSMSISCAENLITFDYLSGVNIGGQAYQQVDLTDIDKITYTMVSGHHSYNNYQTPRFAPQLFIENTINPATNFVANTLSPVDGSRITTDDTTLTKTVDVTSLTGNYWIVFCSYGCDSTVKDMYLGDADTIHQTYLKVNGVWQALIGSDINDVRGVST